ncbi:hypothetical protein OQ482_07415 [Enterobacter bugandensis]|uniref:type I-F CRISPR-associated protein Csy1 n=1 Tax=Enterobacter bugandensis TaxID=881260 RepID=UPI00283AA1BC|nr:type I-F CRISPR-associated protein Csy1 [Enterobacter bugandensis]WMU44064.1 hypothetical protein OQ482_07415 [Enterobacter bugandensis]
MNVLIISRCTKRAREQSCRIIDQFAERTGDAAWQTTITMEGVVTLRKLLRKTARRNTAVACHWLKKNGQTELLWIVGNLRRFNAQGRVPTNRTTLQVIRNDGEHRWQSAESIALLAAIAGLFHDFGKAGMCFQQTLKGESQHVCQPYRHEWISVRLFEAFVGERSDEQWLASLTQLKAADEKAMLKALKMDSAEWSNSPFEKLPPLLARTGDYTNVRIREARDEYIDALIDLLFVVASELQRDTWQNWTLSCERLVTHQQLWLDPWRTKTDEAFRLERDKDDWQVSVATDFALWLNARLSKALKDLGYLVPLMTGYQRISELYAPGVVANARDAETPFAFTEAVYGVGEWCGLHRIRSLDEIFWRYRTTETGYYCQGAGAPVTTEHLN